MAAAHSWGFRQNPWVYFSFFLISNALISYSPLPVPTKVLLGLLGVILPLYVAFRTSPPPSRAEKPGYLADLKLSVPSWLWALAILSLIFLRFYKLETLPCWPNLDEGWIGTLAIELSRHWTWKFFYTFGETPPLSIWCPALLFKLGCSPAFSLWFPPAMVSLLTVFAAYFSARRFFSGSFSLIAAGLMAFSFWPLFISRICHQGIWLPLWVCLVLFFWGRFQKTRGDSSKRNWSLGLGFCLGFGSFTFTPWMEVAGVFFLFISIVMLWKPKKDWRNFSFFCFSFFISLIPFVLAVLREGYGHHILSLSPWGGWFHGLDFFFNLFKYSAVLIWNACEKDPAYTPVWGGFLNPILGACFLVGIIEMFHLRRQRLIQWIAVVFLLFLLPGALSPNLETFRIAQILPLLLLMTTFGIHSLLIKIPAKKQLFTLTLLLAFTAIFDFNLLGKPYRNPDAHPENFGRPLKSLEKYRAFQIFSNYPLSLFKGLLMTNFDTDSFNDPTLSVMTYPYQLMAGHISKGQDVGPEPLALFVNIHYQPYLKSRFPDGKWFPVCHDLSPEKGQAMLCLLSGTVDLRRWWQVHFIFKQADLQRFSQNNEEMKASIQILEGAYPLVQGDPFLESVYWDKRAAYEYGDLNYDEQLRSYQMAVTRGYPTADFYYKMGQLYLVRQRYTEARQAFFKATQAPLDLTPAKSLLEELKTVPMANRGNN